jgi:hypothetical protein
MPSSRTPTRRVLRSGYIANLLNDGDPETLAVNLSSDRVRVAMSSSKAFATDRASARCSGAVRARPPRRSHARRSRPFKYPLRKAFPLAADALTSTKTDPTVPIEAIEAERTGRQAGRSGAGEQHQVPYGLTGLPAVKKKEEQDALNAETLALLDA